MSESFRTSPDKIRSNERMRERLQVIVGDRDAFNEAKQEAAERGVETIDPLRAGIGPAVSSISELSKRSLDYSVCTGLAVIGRTPVGGRVSFVTHQIPTNNEKFMAIYREKIAARLREFQEKTVPGSLDAVLFGGEVGDIIPGRSDAERQASRKEWYESMRQLMGEIVRETVGVELRIGDGPNRPGEHLDMFLDTQGAKLYIERE